MAKITVRPAHPYEAVRIAKMLEEFDTFVSRDWPKPEPEALISWVLQCIEHGYTVVGQHSDSSRLLGVAAIMEALLPWNRTHPVLQDQFFYVPDAARRYGIATALMAAMKAKAAVMELPLIMNIVTGHKDREIGEWYELNGAELVGGTYVFNMPERSHGQHDLEEAA